MDALATVPPHPLAAEPVRSRFTADWTTMLGMLVRGSLLQLVTAGLYRFWYITDLRRFYWNHTEIDGDALEYTGRGLELFIGFAVALAVVLPLYVLVFIVSLEAGPVTSLVVTLGFTLLVAFLAQYAVYRARRYRLTRTIWRGLRFHQSGSGWSYAVRAALWWTGVLLSLGLLYPFARAALERYKMRHTWYGDLGGAFRASGWSFLLRGVVLWAVMLGPLAWALARLSLFLASEAAAEWFAFMDEVESPDEWLTAAPPELLTEGQWIAGGLAWALMAAILLYPLFQAIEFRWWARGVRFGAAGAVSALRNRSVYGTYLFYLLAVMGFGTVLALALGSIGMLAAGVLSDKGVDLMRMDETAWGQILTVGGVVLVYAVAGLAYAALYQLVIVRRLWRLKWESLAIGGLAAFDAVRARGDEASAFGEGLVDALDVAGF